MTKRILVVEDDTNIRRGLVDSLESEGYEVESAPNGRIGLELFQKKKWNMVLLDLMMPEMSGYDVCREIRKTNETIPIIILTAKGEEIDKVLGLELGADDYITKPFGIHELHARIAANIRRSAFLKTDENKKEDLPEEFLFGGLTIDRKKYEAKKSGKKISLTSRELKLIETFYRHKDVVLPRDQLLNEVWGIDYQGTTRTLDQHIAQLRKKIEDKPESPTLILTVHGVGYRSPG